MSHMPSHEPKKVEPAACHFRTGRLAACPIRQRPFIDRERVREEKEASQEPERLNWWVARPREPSRASAARGEARPTAHFRHGFSLVLMLVMLVAETAFGNAGTSFRKGVEAFDSGDYATAADRFEESILERPSVGSLVNLGLAQWQRGRAGYAILAWEQALWLRPSMPAALGNLRYARDDAQVEAPELTWYETASTWLPADWWAWLTAVSLWVVVGFLTLPEVLHLRKASWHQAVAATGLAVFLLCLPAQYGLHTRTKLGFVLQRDVPLRLTPTRDAEAVTRLAAGEPARFVRSRNDYVYVRTRRASGWLESSQFGRLCP